MANFFFSSSASGFACRAFIFPMLSILGGSFQGPRCRLLQETGWVSAMWNNGAQSGHPRLCHLRFAFWCCAGVLSLLPDQMWCLGGSLRPHFAGDNFFKSASYTVEIMCAGPFSEEKEKLRTVEAKLLTKRAELSKFEAEYREVGQQILSPVHERLAAGLVRSE